MASLAETFNQASQKKSKKKRMYAVQEGHEYMNHGI